MNKAIVIRVDGLLISLAVFAAGFFHSCGPLEGSAVIGPGGGYVFYDEGSYTNGWRYLESAPESAGELSGASGTSIDFEKAGQLADTFSYGGKDDWRLPTDDEFRNMAEYFLDKNTLVNDHPPDRGGLKFNERTFYVTSDGHVFSFKTEITTDSNGNKKGNSEIVQGSEVYESDCRYIVHTIRGF